MSLACLLGSSSRASLKQGADIASFSGHPRDESANAENGSQCYEMAVIEPGVGGGEGARNC